MMNLLSVGAEMSVRGCVIMTVNVPGNDNHLHMFVFRSYFYKGLMLYVSFGPVSECRVIFLIAVFLPPLVELKVCCGHSLFYTFILIWFAIHCCDILTSEYLSENYHAVVFCKRSTKHNEIICTKNLLKSQIPKFSFFYEHSVKPIK